MNPNEGQYKSFDELAAAFVEHLQSGSADSTEIYVLRYPQWADEIHELFPTIIEMEELKTEKSSGMSGRERFSDKMPERLGDFILIREIGRGGMGIVYEAEQVSLSRRVALKLLPKNYFTDSTHHARFQREAQTAGRLHHTNIVPVYGTGTVDGYDFYVMQLIDGQPLDEFIESRRNIHRGAEYFRLIARIGIQAARALAYAHNSGVLHRDIKPGNLLLQQGETADEITVWITDFGLAKSEQDEAALTRTDNTLGTLRYMPVEQIEGHPESRSDIYSLGLTLYELLTLRPAYQDDSPVRLVQRIHDSSPSMPRSFTSAIPVDLETIILKAIAREPSRRYVSADALADDLQRFIEDRPIRARRIGPVGRTYRWSRRNPLSASLISMVLLLGIGIVTLTTFGYFQAKAAEYRETQLRISESEGRQREALERHRAEQALELTMETLDELFTQVEASRIPGVKMEPAEARRTIETLERMLQFYQQLGEQSGNSEALKLKMAVALRRQGDIHRTLRELSEARANLEQAIKFMTPLFQADPENTDYNIEYSRAQYTLGRIIRDSGDPFESEALIQAAVDRLKSLPSDIPQQKHISELRRRFESDLNFRN